MTSILDSEVVRRLELLEAKAIKCKCACEGRGGEHECCCIPNVKHWCYPPQRFQPQGKEKPKNYPVGEFDATKWAKEFCEVTGFKDEAWAHSWFASAIMTGFDEAQKWFQSAPRAERCECDCGPFKHGCGKTHWDDKPHDAVEEKISEIINWLRRGKVLSLNDLHELVRIVREGK